MSPSSSLKLSLVIVIISCNWSCWCAATSAGDGNLKNEDKLLYLTPGNYEHMVKTVAGAGSLVVLTTLSVFYRGAENTDTQLQHMKNFAYHLQSCGRLENTLTIAHDVKTCTLLNDVSIACFVDKVGPKLSQLPERLQGESGHFAKYWHALALLKLGITVFFSDTDAAILQDPFLYQDRHFDIEGLSDWNWLSQLPTTRAMLKQPCLVYKSKKDDNVHGGKSVDWEGAFEHADPKVQTHMSPCQSTGGWFASPTQSAIAFLEDLIDRVTVTNPDQWDQAAWNEAIIPHLYGLGARLPLTFRVLPVESFSNLPTHIKRKEDNLPVNQVMLHAGGLHDQEKIKAFMDVKLWKAVDWDPSIGDPILHHLQAEFSKACNKELTTTVRTRHGLVHDRTLEGRLLCARSQLGAS